MNAIIQVRLQAARMAVDYVKQKLPRGPGNKVDDAVLKRLYNEQRQAGDSVNVAKVKAGVAAVATSFLAEAGIVGMRMLDSARRNLAGRNLVGIERLREVSRQAEKIGAGNCSDQAAMAFVHLYDHADASVRPLDLMFLTNGKHAFVALGIKVRHALIKVEGVEHPSMWGDETVICDPWNNDAYYLEQPGSANLLLSKMKCNCAQATSQFRSY